MRVVVEGMMSYESLTTPGRYSLHDVLRCHDALDVKAINEILAQQ